MDRNTPPKNFTPVPFEYGQKITLKISDLNNFGVGVGRIDGWVVMVPYALAGETVEARVWRNHKNYSQADLVEVVEKSPDRTEPFCPLFGECGGCQYQHLSYAKQLEWKRSQVETLMRRIGGLEDINVLPVKGSPVVKGYRSKLTPHYEKPSARGFAIGFVRQGRRTELVDVENCPIASDAINAALHVARASLQRVSARLKRGGTILLRDTLSGVTQDNTAIASEKVGPFIMSFCAGEFFQNNPHMLPQLLEYAVSEAEGNRFLVDAYCGVGVFSIWASSRFEKVLGVEISAKSIECARANAAANNASNCSFMAGKAECIFEGVDFPGNETSVIIDPPRSGCDSVFLNQLTNFSPKKIVYVSCGPDTQARDLAILCAKGYRVEHIQPFDMFPQTRHIESVATLSRAKSD